MNNSADEHGMRNVRIIEIAKGTILIIRYSLFAKVQLEKVESLLCICLKLRSRTRAEPHLHDVYFMLHEIMHLLGFYYR